MIWVLSLTIIVATSIGQLIRIPVATGGITMLDIAISGLSLIGLTLSKFKLNSPSTFIKVAFVFIFIGLFSLIFSPIKLLQQELSISLGYIIRFSLYILFAWILYSGGLRELAKFAKPILLISGIALSIIGLLQFVLLPDLKFLQSSGWDPHYFRTVSTFLDPNFAGAYFVLTLLLLVQNPGINTSNPRVFYIFFSIVYLALLTTFSRSSYGMFLISLLALSYFLKSWRMAFLSVALFILLLLSFQTYGQAVAKPRSIDRSASAGFRLNTWQQGWELFQKHPILGVGFNAYRYGLRQYNLGDEQFLSSRGSAGNDSSLLFVASTTGAVGLLAYLGMLLSLLKFGFLKNALLFSGLFGLLFHSIFANSLFYPPILLWILLNYDKD